MAKKLTKSRTNIVIAGVLGGIGEYLNIDPTILRVLYVIGTFFSAGAGVLLYFILMMVMPSGGRDSRYGGRRRGSYYNNNQQRTQRPRKEAEKVDDESDWSDF